MKQQVYRLRCAVLLATIPITLSPPVLLAHAQDRDGAFGSLFSSPANSASAPERAGSAQIVPFEAGILLEEGKHYRAQIRYRDGRWVLPAAISVPDNAPHVALHWENINRFSRMSHPQESDPALEHGLDCVFTVQGVMKQCLLPPCPSGISDVTFLLYIQSIR